MGLLSAVIALVVAGSGDARASGEAEEAEITFNLGAKAYGEGDFQRALAQFLASNRLAPNPSVAFNIGRCYAKLEKYAEAYRWFTIAGEALQERSVQEAVQAELRKITPNVVIYDLQSDPPGATVYSERKDLGVVGITPLKIALAPLDKGTRTFIFEKMGYQDVIVGGLRGSRGEVLPVTGDMKQIVGTIEVHAPEGTTVHIGAPDAPPLCTVPCDPKLAPGNWVLYFRKEGYRDAVRQIEVTAEQTTTTLVELAPNTGSVVVNASERGALIEVDGKAAGFTPTVVQGVPVGRRVVRVSRPGYVPIEVTVTVETDRQVNLDDLELLPLNEVTAVSRRAERIELAPSSVTIIGQEELKAFQYPTIFEALRGVRGFALTYDSVYGGTNIRGLGQASDFNNKMLVLSDGANLNDNFFLQSFISYDGRVDLGGVERIEVVRGPGSVLYGTGAVSGVVNLVTDSLDAPEGTSFSVGSYDNHVVRGRAQAHYKLGDGIGFRAAASGATSQGRDEVLDPRRGPNVPVQGFDEFDAGTTDGRIWLRDLSLQWLHTTRTISIPTGLYFTLYNSPKHVWTDTRTMVELKYEPHLSEAVTLLSRAYFNRYDFFGILPFQGNYQSVDDILTVTGGAEARLQIEPSERFRLTAGGQIENSPTAKVFGHDELPNGDSVVYVDVNQPYTVAAGYGLLDLVPVDAVRLTLGARADYWSTFGGPAISPRVALVLIPDDGDYVKIMAGRAFRAPSIYEFAYDAAFQIKPDDIKPETVWSGEVEYSHAFDEAWTGLVALHGSLAENLIVTVDAGPEAVTFANSDLPIRVMGADVELRRAFLGGWMLSGFYSALDSRYTDGELVPNAPQHNGGVKVIVPISAPTARVAFRASLDAPRRIDLTRFDKTEPAVVADVVLSGMVPEREFEYGVGVYNLFNMRYHEPVVQNYPYRTIPQQGRSLMATLGMRF